MSESDSTSAPPIADGFLRRSGPIKADDRLLAWALAIGTFVLLWTTQRPVGYVRDEGYYFSAAQSYEDWFVEVGNALSTGNFVAPLRDSAIVAKWDVNHEHPPAAKTMFALSHLVFHKWLKWMDDSTAFRFPAFIIGGVVSWALFWLTRPAGRAAAVIAPLLFWLAPRHFFHGHLAAFDMPVVATWVVFFLLYARSIETGKGGWKAGAAFGVALATKHNAFFLPIVVVLHWLITQGPAIVRARGRGLFGRIPQAMWAMAIMGPAILYASWPYLWHHPIERVSFWLNFHLQHVHYAWQYMGTVLRAPPFPIIYPIALEGMTLPLATLVVLALGLALICARAIAGFIPRLAALVGTLPDRDSLMAIGAVVAIFPFMTRVVPIFGGVKHWMASPALLSVFGAEALVLVAAAAWPKSAGNATAILAALVLIPGAWATEHFHPFGTSAYNEAVGGGAGGAALGMQRQYWSNNVTSALPWIDEHAPQNATVDFHEVNYDSFNAYKTNGHLRPDINYTQGPWRANVAAYQYHQEFRYQEFEIWTDFGTRTPDFVFAIDEAPQIYVYSRVPRIR